MEADIKQPEPVKSSTIWYKITIMALVVVLFATFQECSRQSGQAADNMNAVTDTVKYFENETGTQTASIAALQLTNKQLQKNLIDKDAELKQLAKEFARVKSVTKYGSNVKFDSIGVKFNRPISSTPCDSISEFKRTGVIDRKWYSLGYEVNNDSLFISPFKTWTNTTVITGFKRKWFLGKQTLTTDITNDNPHITITGIKSAEVIVPEPWYKKWYLWLATGLAAGLLLK